MVTRMRRYLFIALFFATLGCGQDAFELAPVSGRVTLDGKPVKAARVRFLPQKQGEGALAGPASIGETDEEGCYTMHTGGDSARPGAVVGKHRVIISTYRTKRDPQDRSGRKEIVVQKETIPRPYNDMRNSPLLLEVPEEGTDQADFALTHPDNLKHYYY